MKANEIIRILDDFKDSSYQSILINGNWGIGKTKYVSDFLKSYSNACYVSLFGKKDINSIIQEIYFRIVEKAPNGNIKKFIKNFKEKLNSFDVSFFGISVSIPLIENIHNTLHKELKKKKTYIIVFDDLERKHDDLSIKEILGLLDSLSKIENIKTVLIAAKDLLEKEDGEVFINYQEKAIDRIYTIEEFAEDAPVDILGEHVWGTIGTIAGSFQFNNLRTFEKTNLFIKEVTKILGEEIFSNKFTKDDLYRMCFATVFFNIEHKGEMDLLENKNDLLNSFYISGENGVIEYLCKYILNNSIENNMNKRVFHHILNWHKTGTYSKEKIINLIESINNFEEEPINFYSSEQDILNMINHSREYIKNLNGTESIEEIITNLSTSFAWCDVLSIEFGLTNDEILLSVMNNISNSINIEEQYYQNGLDLWSFHIESDIALQISNLISSQLMREYYNQLIQKIKNNFTNRIYSEHVYLKHLNEMIYSIEDEQLRSDFLSTLVDNQYFFPVPSGKINEEQWKWCHNIKKLLKDIELFWKVDGYYSNFKDYINELAIEKNEKMLQHRLKTLLNGY